MFYRLGKFLSGTTASFVALSLTDHVRGSSVRYRTARAWFSTEVSGACARPLQLSELVLFHDIAFHNSKARPES